MSKPALRVPQETYEFRVKMMARMIELKARPSMIELSARNLVRCFPRRSLLELWNIWKWHFPEWMIWVFSKDYRDLCREEPDVIFEEWLRDALRPRPAQPSESASPAPVAPSSPESEGQVPPATADKPV
jgi:hypothetical protein